MIKGKEVAESDSLAKTKRNRSYRPELPIQLGPLYLRPLRLRAVITWLFGFPGYFLPWLAFFFSVAVISWAYLTPDINSTKTFSIDWIAFLFVRNLMLLVVFVGALHGWLYARQSQGTQYKYNSSWLADDNPTFLFRNQLWDNVFWNVCSAVPIWTAYEALTFWMQSNAHAPVVNWERQPVYSMLLVLLIPIWISIHFYATHRFLHWRPLYRAAHYVHHKNVNFGPWSGLAIHPVEHLVYFSGVMLFWFIPSHPVHVLYSLLIYASAGLAHVGFGRLVVAKKFNLSVEDYMHYLHHKYFDANFGTDTGLIPLDKWLGTFHDGSHEATEALNRPRRERLRRSRGK